MRDDEIPDERLAALADGELAPVDAAALRAKIGADPDLAERYAPFVETRALLEPKHGLAANSEDPGLDRLAAAIRAADAAPRRFRVIEGDASPKIEARPSQVRPQARFRVAIPALAASVALIAGGLIGYAVGGRHGESQRDIAAIEGVAGARAALAQALERSKSGEPASWSDADSGLAGSVTVIASHRLKDGRLCREHETRVTGAAGTIGFSCRQPNGGWRSEIAVRQPAQGGDYAAASGASLVENAIAELGGGALPGAEESALLEKGWKP